MRLGLDVGSTTLKCVVWDDHNGILYQEYTRHKGRVRPLLREMLARASEAAGTKRFQTAVSGSAGMGIAERMGLPFIQEVYAVKVAAERLLPEADTIIELGGEDAKILFLRDAAGHPDLEVRMNGSCAGGTGAFIDQMAALLDVTADDLNDLASRHTRVYTIASRCGVFAKSDVQPLINQGASREDISASILRAVVSQTVAGLAQGRRITGQVAYLGGPLTFMSELLAAFDEALGTTGICPANSLYFVSCGAAFQAVEEKDTDELCAALEHAGDGDDYLHCDPLFRSQEEYNTFLRAHETDNLASQHAADYRGDLYIGVDAGSTTVKAVALDAEGRILLSEYHPNRGGPVPQVLDFLKSVYARFPFAHIAGAVSTGYGEELIKTAFRLDAGLVETIAHFTAAKAFLPSVDFILDIGGQDIKCFHVRKGAIDNIFLNEACSSGCGSFLQTFADSWGLSIAEFAKLGLFAARPVDLGSRCTVFMNSSVKQAQKDGATLDNISAGLSMSVVKNALYKVIRAPNRAALGEHIVVQGGTFQNDAVLRAFELELGHAVTRPAIAGLMGAYGAALHARSLGLRASSVLTLPELREFTHTAVATTCGGCGNHCALTVNRFSGGRRLISGNRCETPLGVHNAGPVMNLFADKRRWLAEYTPVPGKRGKIGFPMGLGMYELLPFWHTLFTRLGFEVVVSPASSRELYAKGQYTIASDTVCYPAKLLHGHVEALLDEGVDTIFFPCLTYNLDEHTGNNHYNCPVVAYYAEVLKNNMPRLREAHFISGYLGPHDPKQFVRHFREMFEREFGPVSLREVRTAADAAYAEYERYMRQLRETGQQYITRARALGMPVIVLAGRPYHADAEISHGIDTMICGLGAAVVTEDAVACEIREKVPVEVLNQWTYHARLYAAAKYVAENPDCELVQLVSFGCGVDAITTDEVRRILEESGRVCTQIKIDEIANLGSARLRLRSLFAVTGKEASHDRTGGIHSGDEKDTHDSPAKHAAGAF